MSKFFCVSKAYFDIVIVFVVWKLTLNKISPILPEKSYPRRMPKHLVLLWLLGRCTVISHFEEELVEYPTQGPLINDGQSREKTKSWDS